MIFIYLCNLDYLYDVKGATAWEKYSFASTKKNPAVTLIGGELQSWQGMYTIWIAVCSLISMWPRETMPFPAYAPYSSPSTKTQTPSPPFSFDVKYTSDYEILWKTVIGEPNIIL